MKKQIIDIMETTCNITIVMPTAKLFKGYLVNIKASGNNKITISK